MAEKNKKPDVRRLELENIGPIKKADITYGDLTVFIGPQASGKTIFLQFTKLLEDIRYIVRTLKNNDWYWDKDLKTFLQLFFGEGMDYLISNKSVIKLNSKKVVDLGEFINLPYGLKNLSCFYIPAQRYLTLENGWPRSFNNYIERTPYIMREFGDVLNKKILPYSKKNIHLFPMEGKLKKPFKDKLEESIFENSHLVIKQDLGSHKIELSPQGGKESIPLNASSAGQREFIPYIYGLYYLLPSGKVSKVPEIKEVIIEELEMGLHPKAIGDAFLTVLDLLIRGYRVIMSTHSPVMLDYVWALVEYQKNTKKIDIDTYLGDLFNVESKSFLNLLKKNIGNKKIKLYYFKPTGKYSASITQDISSLDIFSENKDISSWGELTAFSSYVGDVVSQLYK